MQYSDLLEFSSLALILCFPVPLQDRDLVRLMMFAVGRGGQGDMGQRIRDEILTVQSKNGAKGGMMEEWHQKLHNNTTPDDVIICEVWISTIYVISYEKKKHKLGEMIER